MIALALPKEGALSSCERGVILAEIVEMQLVKIQKSFVNMPPDSYRAIGAGVSLACEPCNL